MIILVQKSCLHNDCKRNQSRTKIPYTMRSSASTGGRHFLTISLDTAAPGCDVGYGEREFQRQLSASRFVCYCVSSDHAYRNSMELFNHAVRHNPAVSRNILTKWQPPIWLGYRKAGVLHAAPTPPTVVAQA